MSLIKQEPQVVSRKRVTDHGEVYTGKREVNEMLDLVKQETERIESRFLEPACGTGNFLTEILERKLRIVESRYRKSQLEYERYAVLAVSSLYGIDKLKDNVVECRKRLFEIFNHRYSSFYKGRAKVACRKTVLYILERNILQGDALTLETVADNPQPIVFSEWSFTFNDSKIKRQDFTFSSLIPGFLPRQKDMFQEPDLFSEIGEKVFIPKAKKNFTPVHFLKIGEEHD
jgi:hypothetical protein